MDKYLQAFSDALDFNWPFESKPSNRNATPTEWTIQQDKHHWPKENYVHPPLEPFNTQDLSIHTKNMTSFYVAPGEFGYFVDGKDFGFESLSFVLTNTQPGGGPPLHTHSSEEAHVVTEGEVLYYLDGKRFKRKGPYVLRIPANVPHTFLNIGKTPFHLVAVFPLKQLDITELGSNPLVNEYR